MNTSHYTQPYSYGNSSPKHQPSMNHRVALPAPIHPRQAPGSYPFQAPGSYPTYAYGPTPAYTSGPIPAYTSGPIPAAFIDGSSRRRDRSRAKVNSNGNNASASMHSLIYYGQQIPYSPPGLSGQYGHDQVRFQIPAETYQPRLHQNLKLDLAMITNYDKKPSWYSMNLKTMAYMNNKYNLPLWNEMQQTAKGKEIMIQKNIENLIHHSIHVFDFDNVKNYKEQEQEQEQKKLKQFFDIPYTNQTNLKSHRW
jgi:hypothetical protein